MVAAVASEVTAKVPTVQHRISRAACAIAFAALASLASLAQAGTPVLRDQTGHAFTLSALRGTPLVLTFISAHCLDECPLINAQFTAAQRGMRASHLHVRLVTLTLDPEHDSLRDMQRIAHTFDADPRYWTVGAGSIPNIHALMRSFHVTAERGNRQYDDIHTTFVYLIDKRGNLVKTMLASTNFPADLFAELQRNWNQLNV